MSHSNNYHYREHALTDVNRLSLHSDGLASQCGERSRLYAYSDIQSVRLKFDPTRVQTNRYWMDIEFLNAPKLRVTNNSYVGFADFKDQSEKYRGFVNDLHHVLANKNAGVRYFAGSHFFSYLLSLLCTFFVIGILIFANIYLLLTGMFIVVFIKLILIVVYLPTLFRYLKANRARQYKPDAIPELLLPK